MTIRSAPVAPPSEVVWLRPDRWIPLLIWLSLDAVRPYWARMGLSCAGRDQEAWMALLRRFILRATRAHWAHPTAPSMLIAEVTGALAAELGERAGRELVKFGRFTFAMGPEDHPELFDWYEILDRCEPDPGSLEALVPWQELREPIGEGARRARAAVVREEIPLPLSSWDVAMLALRGIDDADRRAAEHPMRMVEWTSRAASARAFWRAILPRVDADRRDVLAWNGARLGWSLATLPREGLLVDPTTLVDPDE